MFYSYLKVASVRWKLMGEKWLSKRSIATMAQVATNTVRLDKMAQHARLWALFMAKLKGQSQNASNMALGKCIGLQHIQISAS